MQSLDASTLSFILGLLSLIGIIFGVYNYFKNPQEVADQNAKLLAQQVKLTDETNQKKFEDITKRISEAMTLSQNHIHTIDTKLDKHIEATNLLSIQIAKLETTINERIPKR